MRPNFEAANSILNGENRNAKFRLEKEAPHEKQASDQHHRVNNYFEKAHGLKYA
jgi:hypothetical protein